MHIEEAHELINFRALDSLSIAVYIICLIDPLPLLPLNITYIIRK